MTTLRTTRMLARYKAWADERIFDAVAKLPEGEATKPRQSLFKNIVHTLNHLYVVDLIFQAHLEGRAHGFTARNTQDHPPVDELRQKQIALDAWFVAWSDGMNEAALDETLHFTFVDGGPGAMKRADMLAHLVNHASYHRGFVAEMFYKIPVRPPVTDLPVFLRDVPLGF